MLNLDTYELSFLKLAPVLGDTDASFYEIMFNIRLIFLPAAARAPFPPVLHPVVIRFPEIEREIPQALQCRRGCYRRCCRCRRRNGRLISIFGVECRSLSLTSGHGVYGKGGSIDGRRRTSGGFCSTGTTQALFLFYFWLPPPLFLSLLSCGIFAVTLPF